jgi:hypothetical protein
MIRKRGSGLALAMLLGAAIAASPPGSALAGAWLQEPGTAYVRLSGGYLVTDTRFDRDGNEIPFDNAGGGFRDVEYRDFAAGAYAEWGLHRDWNLITDLTWKRLRADQPSARFTTYGFGDAGVGVKRSLYRGPHTVASAGVSVSVPTGYDPGEYPALGSDTVDLTASLQAGTSTAAYWVNGEAAYRFRGGDFRNQVGGAVTGGFGVSRAVALRGDVRGAVGVGRGPAPDGGLRFDPTAVDPGNLDAAGTVSVRVAPGTALEAEVRSTVWGENTLVGTRFSLAVATSPALRLRSGRER